MEELIYKLTTRDGDIWKFDNLDETRRNQWIFGGEITVEIANEDDLFINQYKEDKL